MNNTSTSHIHNDKTPTQKQTDAEKYGRFPFSLFPSTI